MLDDRDHRPDATNASLAQHLNALRARQRLPGWALTWLLGVGVLGLGLLAFRLLMLAIGWALDASVPGLSALTRWQ